MSPSTPDLRPTISDTPDVQDIPGGTCPLLPMQCCIIWAARQEKAISPLAFKVYFAVHEVKFWRSKPEPGQPYHYAPCAFQLSDVGRLIPGVPAAKMARAFAELQAPHIVSLSDSVGIGFAERLDHVSLHERVKHRAQVMFEQLHKDTRDKLVKIPRRFIKLLIECGRRIVRAATLLGLVLTTVLTKRTEAYEGYKGCAKAKWIATVFGVDVSRVKHERAQWIDEGWFSREPTSPRVRKQYGQWVRLNLSPPSPPPEPVENPAGPAPEVQPQHPALDPEVQPLLNQALSSRIEERANNQTLTPEAPESGTCQPPYSDFLTPEAPEPGADQTLPPDPPTWTHIRINHLDDDAQSEALRQEAIRRGLLSHTEADRLNFFAAIAHALRVAKTNACGLLRTIVENSLWHFISQGDESNAVARLKRSTQAQEAQQAQQTGANPFLATSPSGTAQVGAQPIKFSKDALLFQALTRDLEHAGVTGDLFAVVQQHGYLRDWDRERWIQAQHEVAQARLLFARQQQPMAMTRIEEIIEPDIDDGDEPMDWE